MRLPWEYGRAQRVLRSRHWRGREGSRQPGPHGVPRWQGSSSLFKAGAKARQLRGKHKSYVYHLRKVEETRIKNGAGEHAWIPVSTVLGLGALGEENPSMPSVLTELDGKTNLLAFAATRIG